ncbi:MAG: P-loop NTPase [Rickettsiales bacterium]|nr:P-loop NTPase [Rickettsiales bacterium]
MKEIHQYVENLLKNYRFQDKNIDLFSQNIIKGFIIKNNIITCVVDLQNHDQQFIKSITEDLITKLKTIENVSDIKFTFTNEKETLKKIPGVNKTILISSAKGGVGKSTITFFLAQYLTTQGLKVGILDADIYGPSLPTLTNISTKPEIDNGTWIPHTWNNISLNSIGYLIDKDTSLIWRGPMISKSINQLLLNTRWKDLDYLLVDMPPGTGDIHLSISTQFKIDGCIVISTPHDLSISDTSRTINMYRTLSIPILGIIKNMSFIKEGNKMKYIFGTGTKLHELSEKYNTPIISEIPLLEENKIDMSYFSNILPYLP